MKQRLIPKIFILAFIFIPLCSLPVFSFSSEKNPTYEGLSFRPSEVQDIVVRGVVRDPEGGPLVGATITEKGTNNSVAAGPNGNFSISVKEGAVLTVSFVGFVVFETAATTGRDLEITLQYATDRTSMEVVVTALGIRKEKKKISYATQEVKGAALEKAPEPNVANNLIGKVAGLNILSKTNLFENPEILLRGKGTLIVIDGAY